MDLLNLYNKVREDAAIEKIEIDGRTYTSRAIHEVLEPQAKTLTVSTLTGFTDYIKTNIDGLVTKLLVAHIEAPGIVWLRSALHGQFEQRTAHLVADFSKNTEITADRKFGTFLPSEDFHVYMQAFFEDTPHKLEILKYVGNSAGSHVETVQDDGVTQRMTAKVELASVDLVEIPNPVTLRPYRTFNEIDQPESKFIFRAQKGPQFALFPADNNAWKLAAKLSIKKYLQTEIPELHVIA
jgi:hypothetical protein